MTEKEAKMATIDWNQLTGVQEWAAVLKTLLAEAENAIRANDQDAKLSAQRQLLDFIKESPQRCASLDAIANKAAHGLFLDTVDASLHAIAARNDELQQALATIGVVTEKAGEDARALLLADVSSGLDKITAALEKLQRAAAGDTNLLNRIGKLRDDIAAFRG